MTRYTAIVKGERLEVTLHETNGRIEAVIGDRRYTLEATTVEPGVYWLNSDHGSFEAVVLEQSGGYTVSIGQHHIPVQIVDPRKLLRRDAQAGQDGAIEIRAPMPGKVVRILVGENSLVEANQGVVVMEAMKMQNEIKCPKKGKVRNVSVAEGAAVNAGDLIAIVE